MPTMRIVVDRDLCESNAVCERLAPTVFRINPDEDRMELLQEIPDEAARVSVEHAVRMCPRGALSLEPVR